MLPVILLSAGAALQGAHIGANRAGIHSIGSHRASLPRMAVQAAKPTAAGAQALSRSHPVDAFPRTWVPLASTFELDPDRPTPVRFLNQQYVAFRDNDGEWRVMDDACSHRLAPLSEGRIDREANTIECAYHGWAFAPGTGACTRIPQANDAVSKAAVPSPRACVASYPTRVHKSLLWAWPWEEDSLAVLADERAQPEGLLAGVAEDASTYTRDLPYGWDTLLENIVDPAHIPFAHHGLQGKREDAIAINMTNPKPTHAVAGTELTTRHAADAGTAAAAAAASTAAASGLRGFSFEFGDRTMGKMRAGTGEFRAPCTHAPAGSRSLATMGCTARRPPRLWHC